MTAIEPYTAPLPAEPDAIPEDLRHLVDAWVASKKSAHTRIAYARDLISESPKMPTPSWIVWCLRQNTHPLTATQPYVDTYARLLETNRSSPATIARKLAAISSWYTYLIRQEVTDKNPAKWVERPEIDRDVSNAVGLTMGELRSLIAFADADGLRSSAIVRMLALNGVRVGVIIAMTPGSLGRDRGHRTIKLTLKGGREVKAPLTPEVTDALDAYVAERGKLAKTDLIFATVAGHPLDQPYIWRLVKSLARRAGIPAWEDISPHSLRHTFATLALDMEIPLAVVQDAMGHKDPRTTQRYNRARFRLDNHPTYALAAKLLPPESLRDEPEQSEP